MIDAEARAAAVEKAAKAKYERACMECGKDADWDRLTEFEKRGWLQEAQYQFTAAILELERRGYKLVGMVGWISADSLGYYYHKGGEIIGPFSNEAAAISAMITSHDLQYREHAKGKN